MKTDRELLELAAQVSGVTVGIYQGDDIGFEVPFSADWNPLKDDGDAFRLAVHLGMDVIIDHGVSYASIPAWERMEELHSIDKASATRRAIVRAAAAIWEAMQ